MYDEKSRDIAMNYLENKEIVNGSERLNMSIITACYVKEEKRNFTRGLTP